MLCYHGTPLGGKSCERPRFFRNRHALVSFARTDDLEVVAECCRSFCFDNGAFSAWRSGKPITNWVPYYEWCREWVRHPGFDFGIIPDVIEGTEDENDKEINKWFNWSGWNIGMAEGHRFHIADRFAPVWHMHESIERLKRLCRYWSRVCFGSSGDFATVGTAKWSARIHEAFEAICVDGRPMSKIHGLRMMDPAVFHRFPFSSVDSTNVAQNASREAERHRVSVELAREIIAGRIECHNSANEYKAADKQKTLIFQ